MKWQAEAAPTLELESPPCEVRHKTGLFIALTSRVFPPQCLSTQSRTVDELCCKFQSVLLKEHRTQRKLQYKTLGNEVLRRSYSRHRPMGSMKLYCYTYRQFYLLRQEVYEKPWRSSTGKHGASNVSELMKWHALSCWFNSDYAH
jgi:hypothetical protein